MGWWSHPERDHHALSWDAAAQKQAHWEQTQHHRTGERVKPPPARRDQ
jgi:hypothetical protein